MKLLKPQDQEHPSKGSRWESPILEEVGTNPTLWNFWTQQQMTTDLERNFPMASVISLPGLLGTLSKGRVGVPQLCHFASSSAVRLQGRACETPALALDHLELDSQPWAMPGAGELSLSSNWTSLELHSVSSRKCRMDFCC